MWLVPICSPLGKCGKVDGVTLSKANIALKAYGIGHSTYGIQKMKVIVSH
jgi:hypothetical protein